MPCSISIFPYDDSDARRESEGKTHGYEARLYRKHNGDRRGEHLLYDCAFDAMSMRLGSSSAISRQICDTECGAGREGGVLRSAAHKGRAACQTSMCFL